MINPWTPHSREAMNFDVSLCVADRRAVWRAEESGVRVINHCVDGDLARIVVGDGWPVSLSALTSRWSPREFSSALQPKAFSLRMDWVHLNSAPTHTFRNTSSNVVFCLVISFSHLWESATDSSVYKTAKLSSKSAPFSRPSNNVGLFSGKSHKKK